MGSGGGRGEMETVRELKRKLRSLESLIEREAVILLKGSGHTWISRKARAVIKNKKIKQADLLGWLSLGARHLSSATFCGLDVVMMRLPDSSNDILAILKEECRPYPDYGLTAKEKEIVVLLAYGNTNKEIASSLNISPGTVNTHLDSIYRKLDVSNRSEAVFVALKKGLVVAGPEKP